MSRRKQPGQGESVAPHRVHALCAQAHAGVQAVWTTGLGRASPPVRRDRLLPSCDGQGWRRSIAQGASARSRDCGVRRHTSHWSVHTAATRVGTRPACVTLSAGCRIAFPLRTQVVPKTLSRNGVGQAARPFQIRQLGRVIPSRSISAGRRPLSAVGRTARGTRKPEPLTGVKAARGCN